jgi:hypothetical protein
MSALDTLRHAGLTVEAEGDRLLVQPRSLLNEDLRALLREHKPEILALLRCAAPFDRESWEERAAIAEFDGALSCEEAEALAWREDDRRRCRHCLNLSKAGTCTVASPGGLVFARRGYEPIQDILRRCEGYRPCENDPDQRPGAERWLGLRPVLEGNA